MTNDIEFELTCLFMEVDSGLLSMADALKIAAELMGSATEVKQ